ncbi:MAG: Stk1 family PASTA domain-containing Ser/Thr kinase [Rubrobacteraceae bacterium]
MPPMQQFVDNRYRLEETLGSGGMADVYLAHDDILDRTLALKVLSTRYADDEEFIERFRREAQNAASLAHPNIVSIYDRGETEDGTYYIAMEYLPGGTLKDRIVKRGPLPARTAAAVALQISEALKCAHESDVVHRDIKPHNILITESGDIKVTDFGIARAASSSTMTKTGSILGTAHYLSPEQAMGEPVRPQSDLYSLGVVLYEMLTGKLPYDAETPIGIAMKHVNGEMRPPIEVDPSIPAGINAVVMRLLARNPEDRYADAAALTADLERVSAGLEPEGAGTQEMTRVMPPAAPPPSPPRKVQKSGGGGSRRYLPIALALLALVLLAGLAWAGYSLLSGDGGPTGPPAPAMIQVPDLEGKALDEARQDVDGDFEIAENGQENSSRAENTILGQDPSPGEQGEKGSEIGVTVSSGQNEVPDVKGTTPAEARVTLEGEGFEVKENRSESSAEQEGRVTDQNPGADSAADVGSTVEITVGTGVANVEVPNLYDMSLDAAAAEIQDAGLTYNGNDSAASDEVAEGNVISQSIAAGTSVEPGTGVGIRISTGPESISVPNLYGYTLDEAAAELEGIGLQLGGNEKAPSEDIEEGGIIGQSFAAGATAEPGTSIGVTVSSGPEQTSVPDVAGDNLQTAQRKITDAGFTYTTLSSQSAQWPAGTVLYTDPGAGTQLESGSTVTIGYSSGPGSSQNNQSQEEARKERQKAQEEARKERQQANRNN